MSDRRVPRQLTDGRTIIMHVPSQSGSARDGKLLAPEIVEAILDGRQPAELQAGWVVSKAKRRSVSCKATLTKF